MKSFTRVAILAVVAIALTQQMRSESVGQNPPADVKAGATDDDAILEVVPGDRKYSFWMDQKLRLSKDILTGLAMGDFDTIGRSAEIMKGLNRLERFVRRSPEGYREHLAQFNYANKKLLRAVDAENLDAATLAFHQLTNSCVSCHQSLRTSEPAHETEK